MANGLPIEGKEADAQHAGDVARVDVPTCSLSDRVSEVKELVQIMQWDSCVVVNAKRVVLGLLRPQAFEVGSLMTAEQAMENGPRTYRWSTSLEKAADYMQKNGVDSVPVTTTDGKLFGLLVRADVDKALSVHQ
jgi:CBS domain-containing protein